jgi:5'-methylthioadenosine phosphorylase
MQAEVGIFGGSGFYTFAEGECKEVAIETPYGAPSDKLILTTIAGRKVAFLPRHGKDHQLPPHMINYRANLAAMKQLGVKWVFGPCAAGSLEPKMKPGDFVICDQFANRTWGRRDTFFDGPITTHIGASDPYCPQLRQLAIASAKELEIPCHSQGTVVVVNGPRFSTRAESAEFRSHGWQVINMTQYPEAILARELEMCYANISLITDYDVGLEGEPNLEPVSHEAVMEVFQQNIEKLRALLFRAIAKLPQKQDCSCASALKTARGES